jgi:hypothetical protein
MERRLAAILAVDVVGYSRLMAADETGTLEGFCGFELHGEIDLKRHRCGPMKRMHFPALEYVAD